MTRLAMINGKVYAPGRARVSVYDRGFLYGDSVFETIRTYHGRPFALEEHVARLGRSAARVAMTLPLSERELEAEVERAVARANNAESYVRLMLTRGTGPLGLDAALATRPRRVILVEPLSPPPRDLYARGGAVLLVRTARVSDAAPGAKVGNYLESLLALRKARLAGAHEALIEDAQGFVVEGTTSNVFAVAAGRLLTPPEELGILAGITRARVLSLAADVGLEVELRPLRRGDLLAAEEVFLTSTLRELVPVVRIDGEPVGAGAPGDTTRALHAALRRKVGLGDAPPPWQDPP